MSQPRPPCQTCSGTGKLKVADPRVKGAAVEKTCPACNGTGRDGLRTK